MATTRKSKNVRRATAVKRKPRSKSGRTAPRTARAAAPAQGLYPALRPYRTGRLRVASPHEPCTVHQLSLPGL